METPSRSVETSWRVCSLWDSFTRLLFVSRAIGGRLGRPPKRVGRPCYNAGMQNDMLTSLTRLSDAELVARVKSLVARERDATAHLVAHLTPANHRAVLDSARGKKKREIEEIVARLSPRPDVAASVRRLPALHAQAFRHAETAVAPGEHMTDRVAPAPPETAVITRPLSVPRAAVTPLSPDRYKLQLTIGGETLEKLRLAKDMLSHAIPSGDDAAVLDRALTALLVDLAKKKYADTRKPRRSRARDPRARDAAAPVKRAVWVRDLGRCAYVGPSGHRCNERRFVEFHHVDPHALGGEASVEKIELRCRRHNDYEGRLYFGTRRRDDTGTGREEATSSRPKPFEPVKA